MEEQELKRLESRVDLLETELSSLDKLLKKSGFPEGIQTLKGAVEEILKEVGGEDFKELNGKGIFA